MADKQAERIKFEIELLRLIAIAVLAIGGGSIGLLLGDLAGCASSWQGVACSLQ